MRSKIFGLIFLATLALSAKAATSVQIGQEFYFGVNKVKVVSQNSSEAFTVVSTNGSVYPAVNRVLLDSIQGSSAGISVGEIVSFGVYRVQVLSISDKGLFTIRFQDGSVKPAVGRINLSK